MSRRLPIGIQSFRTLRERGYTYVDKTSHIRQLVESGEYYFLSRPRRFGKSLLIDTLRELFLCNEALFEGLHIHNYWEWSQPHQVVRLSFDGKYNEPGEIDGDILEQLESVERRNGLEPAHSANTGPRRLRNILDRLHESSGRQVVVLVDEYDKPILDVLNNPSLARANREYLRGLYGIIKGSAEHVRFVLVTGVSMFSKVSLFSGMNNLKDISLDPNYATICGYTEDDLDTVFTQELAGLDREQIRTWYNGYNWLGTDKVYNPFDVLLLFDERRFRPHWYKTGTPEFLYQLMSEQRTNPMDIEDHPVAESRLTKFDIGEADLRALMFQTGYLTIAEEKRTSMEAFYHLEYPNLEVRTSFSQGMLSHFGRDEAEVSASGYELLENLESTDFDRFAATLQAYFAGIPHQWHDAGKLGHYEAHYAAMLYMTLRAVGADVRAEDTSSHGRADMVLLHGGKVFVLEFKLADDASNAEAFLSQAIDQMKKRGYARKYRTRGEPIHLVGIVFGKEARNLLALRSVRDEAD